MTGTFSGWIEVALDIRWG